MQTHKMLVIWCCEGVQLLMMVSMIGLWYDSLSIDSALRKARVKWTMLTLCLVLATSFVVKLLVREGF